MDIHNFIASKFAGKEPLFFEVGANDGQDTQRLNLSCKNLHVFEPDVRAFAKLTKRKFLGGVFLNNIALGSCVGSAQFHVSSGCRPYKYDYSVDGEWDKSGSLRAPKIHLKAHPWCKFDSTINVLVDTVDNYCQVKGIKIIDFLWADVQGAEEDLIRGGASMLGSGAIKYFYTEYSDAQLYDGQLTFNELCALLKGYKVVHRFPGDVLFEWEK